MPTTVVITLDAPEDECIVYSTVYTYASKEAPAFLKQYTTVCMTSICRLMVVAMANACLLVYETVRLSSDDSFYSEPVEVSLT